MRHFHHDRVVTETVNFAKKSLKHSGFILD